VGIAANFVARVWAEAPFVAEVQNRRGQWERSPGHPLEAAASNLGHGIADSALWTATLADLLPGGNAYWLVGSRRDGSPAAWPVRASKVTVLAGKDGQVAGYLLDGGDRQVKAAPDEVWHFRTGVDPVSPFLGASPLANLVRERAQENAAAEYSLGIARGFGSAGAVFKPSPDKAPPNPRELDAIRSAFREVFSLGGAGGAIVLPPGLELEFPLAGPEALAMGSLASVPSARILAALGLSAMALGLPDKNRTYANYGESLDAAWEMCVLPLKRSVAEALGGFLAREARITGARLAVDVSGVRALQEDANRAAQRASRLFQSGVVDRATAKRAVGIEPEPGDEGLYFTDLGASPTGGGQGASKALVRAMLAGRRGE